MKMHCDYRKGSEEENQNFPTFEKRLRPNYLLRFTQCRRRILLHDGYMTSMEAEIRPTRSLHLREAKKEPCVICFDDIDSDLMFSVDKCSHRFCFDCVKHHVEVKLLDGTIPNCPQHRCKSQLSIDRCGKLLTLKMSLMWKQRIKEDLTPFTERVYCPYPRCSYLMSKTELFSFSESGLRTCFKCSGSFCVRCKVPWHSKRSCTDYKKSRRRNDGEEELIKSLAKAYGWRQCVKCQHMIERSYGCGRIKCRCGHVLCYNCGAEWYSLHRKGCNYRLQHNVLLLLLWAFLYFLSTLVY